jgi:membrane associated rhomboid family serine protease
MISNMLSNLPTVTKNFLIINALMLLATLAFQSQINLIQVLGAHNFLSPLFEPYQIVTHFFMHGDTMHLFFNMFGLLMFGSHLERIWGSKRFFWFYIICALGALAFYAGYGTWEMYQLKQQILALPEGEKVLLLIDDAIVQAVKTEQFPAYIQNDPLLRDYLYKGLVPMVGASGAIYGILVGFAVLFPNTELMLLFPPIPIKAKYLVGILMAVSLYFSFAGSGDNIAHLAHLGGGVIGFLLVKFYQKDKTTFY